MPRLAADGVDVLAPTFVLSADVLRHLQADPLLPRELLPDGWPGEALRKAYDAFDAEFRRVWRDWYRTVR
jgi:phenylacetic acid degradation operon negative regulatory protein